MFLPNPATIVATGQATTPYWENGANCGGALHPD